jgi:hypothetical protein
MSKRQGDEAEKLLPGGYATDGVFRVGDTVRRPTQDSSAFVAELLLLLEAAGFQGAPRYLGRDNQGRETFSYINGEVPTSVRHFSDKQVSAVSRLLREMHDATRSSSLAGGHEVVCHNDLNVRNVVLQDDIPVAWLDFDMAAPGRAITDVSYMAWGFCISSYWPPARSAIEQASQVRVLADAYEVTLAQRAELIDEVITHQKRIIALANKRLASLTSGQNGTPAVADPAFWDGVRDWASRDLEFTAQNAPLFRRALRV